MKSRSKQKVSVAANRARQQIKMPRENEDEVKAREQQEKKLLLTIFSLLIEIEPLSPDNHPIEQDSLEWLAVEICNRLDSYPSRAHQAGYDSYSNAHSQLFDKLISLENLSKGKRSRRAFQDAWREVWAFNREVERLFLAIGFIIGLRKAEKQLAGAFRKTFNPNFDGKYSISTPKPREDQLKSIDDLLSRSKNVSSRRLEKII